MLLATVALEVLPAFTPPKMSLLHLLSIGTGKFSLVPFTMATKAIHFLPQVLAFSICLPMPITLVVGRSVSYSSFHPSHSPASRFSISLFFSLCFYLSLFSFVQRSVSCKRFHTHILATYSKQISLLASHNNQCS